MRTKLKKSVLLAVIAITCFSFKTANLEQVKGWFVAGSDRESYQIGIVNDAQRGGKVAYLKSIKNVKHKFGTIMQTFDADNYLGKKLKLSGYIKTKDVIDWAGMWMRVDGEKGKTLSFDNMGDRRIKGTTGWTKYEIILDVPKTSTTINYGVLLTKTGEVWLDNFTFKEVNQNSKPTGRTILKQPSNTSFEE